ncbi:hypothetical protein EV648_105371 [Kribbella sp. VKM Ac-2568]|nr:hypothetical protein EV648_105371 [Kribbella sp. VKM Ac-2568]
MTRSLVVTSARRARWNPESAPWVALWVGCSRSPLRRHVKRPRGAPACRDRFHQQVKLTPRRQRVPGRLRAGSQHISVRLRLAPLKNLSWRCPLQRLARSIVQRPLDVAQVQGSCSRALPVGRYWRSRSSEFSLVGRCHGLPAWTNNTPSRKSGVVRTWPGISEPWSEVSVKRNGRPRHPQDDQRRRDRPDQNSIIRIRGAVLPSTRRIDLWPPLPRLQAPRQRRPRLRAREGELALGQGHTKLLARADTELAEHVAQVPLDRAATDEELRSDLRIRQAIPHETGYLLLLRS